MKLKSISDQLIITAVFIAFLLILFGTQKVGITDQDGSCYLKIAEQYSQNNVIVRVEKPFGYRIGQPFLVFVVHKITGFDNYSVFFWMNIICGLLSLLLLNHLLKLNGISTPIRMMMVFVLMCNYLGPIRFNFFERTLIDSISLMYFIFMIIFCFHYQRDGQFSDIFILSILSFFGVFIRETMLVVPMAFLFIKSSFSMNSLRNYFSHPVKNLKSMDFSLFLPLVSGLAGTVFVFILARPVGEYSLLEIGWYLITHKSITTIILAYFNVFGFFIVLWIYYFRLVKYFFVENSFLFMFTLGIFILSWFGGADNERFLFWLTPVLLPMTGLILEKNKHLFRSIPLYLILLSYLITGRVIFIIPPINSDSISNAVYFLTPLGNSVNFYDLWSYYCRAKTSNLFLFQYSSVTLFFLAILYFHDRFRKGKVR